MSEKGVSQDNKSVRGRPSEPPKKEANKYSLDPDLDASGP